MQENFPDLADRALVRLEEAARRGPPGNPEICKKIGQEIWEFREGRLRILWFWGEDAETMVISHGFLKRSQKTPAQEKNGP